MLHSDNSRHNIVTMAERVSSPTLHGVQKERNCMHSMCGGTTFNILGVGLELCFLVSLSQKTPKVLRSLSETFVTLNLHCFSKIWGVIHLSLLASSTLIKNCFFKIYFVQYPDITG